MGLFGGGNSSSTTTTTIQDFEGTSSNEADQSGASNPVSVLVAPQIVGGGSIGNLAPVTYSAPLYITPSVNLGDAAVAAAQQTAQSALASSTPNQNTVGSALGSLTSSSSLEIIIVGLVIVMLFRGHAGRL